MSVQELNELAAMFPSVFPEVVEFRGGVWREFLSRLDADDWIGMDDEYLVVGGAGTGKTTSLAFFVHGMCRRFPGAKWLVLRENRVDLNESFMETFEEEVLDPRDPLDSYVLMNGGRKRPVRESRRHYLYPRDRRTGRESRIVLGGMDQWERFRSTRWDGILIIEATEVSKENIEGIQRAMRPQRKRPQHDVYQAQPVRPLIMETNPDGPEHHLKKRADRGVCKLVETTIRDNPTFWNRYTNEATPEGAAYIARMTRGTSGHVYRRLVLNEWAGAVGGIFEMWSRQTHVVSGRVEKGDSETPDRIVFDPPHPVLGTSVEVVSYVGGFDIGLRNAGALGVWAFDTANRCYLVHEVYEPERGIEWWAERVVEAYEEYPMKALACDHNWYFINRFNEELHRANERLFGRFDPGMYVLPEGLSDEVIAAMRQQHAVRSSRDTAGRVRIALNATKSTGRKVDVTNLEMLRRAMMPGLDGVPRLMVLAGARWGTRPPALDIDRPWGFVEEVERAVWAKNQSHDGGPEREEISDKCDDHGIDEAAYAIAWMWGREQRKPKAAGVRAVKRGTWEWEETKRPGKSLLGRDSDSDEEDWREKEWS